MLNGACSVCLPLLPPVMAHTAPTHTKEADGSREVLRRGPESTGTEPSALASLSKLCHMAQQPLPLHGAVSAHHPDVSSTLGLWTEP